MLFSVSCYMNDMHILNPNGTNRLMNHCLKSRPSKWTDGYFFGVYISRLLHSSKHSDFPVVVSDTPKNLRYSEMF